MKTTWTLVSESWRLEIAPETERERELLKSYAGPNDGQQRNLVAEYRTACGVGYLVVSEVKLPAHGPVLAHGLGELCEKAAALTKGMR